jgi:hypothetical protein
MNEITMSPCWFVPVLRTVNTPHPGLFLEARAATTSLA